MSRQHTTGRKLTVLIITVVQVVGFGWFLGHRSASVHRAGWAGVAFGGSPTGEVEQRLKRDLPFVPAAGEVHLVVPGSPAARAGLHTGDVIRAVDGVPIDNLDRLSRLRRRARRGDELTYEVQRAGDRTTLCVQLESPFCSPITVVNLTTSVLVGLAFLVISFLVYWSRPSSRPALVFFLMCVVGASGIFVMAGASLKYPVGTGITPMATDAPGLLLIYAGFVLALLMTNLLLHLSLIFPRTRPIVRQWPKVFVWIHTFPFFSIVFLLTLFVTARIARTVSGLVALEALFLLLLPAAAVHFFRRVRAEGWLQTLRSRPLFSQGIALVAVAQLLLILRVLPDPAAMAVGILVGVGGSLWLFLFVLLHSVLICVCFVRSYRESGVEVQRQIRWPAWGTVTAVVVSLLLIVVGVILTLVVQPLTAPAYLFAAATGVLSQLVSLLIPISFAFAILKYRLMDIDVLIRKTVLYTGLTASILVIYLVLAAVAGVALVRWAGLESGTGAVLATLGVVVVFVPLRNGLQRTLDKWFFRRRYGYEAARAKIAGHAVDAEGLPNLVSMVAEEIQRAVQCRSVAVLTRESSDRAFRPAATVGLPDKLRQRLRVEPDSPVLDEGRTVFEVPHGPAAESLRKAGIALLALSRHRDEPVAVIAIGPKLDRYPFDDDDRGFLRDVAGQTAHAVGRLRGERVQAEFSEAREVQEALLPSALPQVGGLEVDARWRPSREVGGDYYDVIELSDGRLAVCITDVVGKGMPAAVLMANVQAAVKAFASTDVEPQRVCSKVRSLVTAGLSGGKFVTFFYAVLDPAASEIRYTNAGHNPPILVRADGTVFRLEQGGPAIARLMADDPYRQNGLPFETGDVLVLFTDGVTEASNDRGAQFGDDTLQQLVVANRGLGAGQLGDVVVTRILEFTGGGLQDDVTLVVVSRT